MLGIGLGWLVGCGGGGGNDVADETADETGGGSSGTDSDPTTGETEAGDTDDDEVDVAPPPGGLRRLLGHQYTSSVYLLLGAEAAAVANPPNDPVIGTFDAMATIDSVPSAPDVERYESSAAIIADVALANPDRLAQHVPCIASGPYDSSCYESLARDFGRLAWRRPMTDDQAQRLVSIAEDGRAWGEGDFTIGARYMLTAILQSPRFLYLVEVGTPGEEGEARTLDGYELVARMSFFLLGHTPDKILLDAVTDGALDTDEGVRAMASSLVARTTTRSTVERFFDELLTIRRLTTKGKDAELYPTFTESLAEAMREETLRLVGDVIFTREASVLELFSADYTFVDADLAAHYGVEAPGPGQWHKVDLPASQQRAGVLTHASWLSMQSHTDVNSPTRRGLFVLEQLLCTHIPPPPPRVNPEPITPDPDQTLREKLLQMTQGADCQVCHSIIDPIGFAFETYDAIGAYRTLDNGKPIDASGTAPHLGDFDGAAGLVDAIIADPRLTGCLVEKAFTQGLGFVPTTEARPALEEVDAAFIASGADLKAMLVELVSSPIFRKVGEPK
jgi:hypothetical protein